MAAPVKQVTKMATVIARVNEEHANQIILLGSLEWFGLTSRPGPRRRHRLHHRAVQEDRASYRVLRAAGRLDHCDRHPSW